MLTLPRNLQIWLPGFLEQRWHALRRHAPKRVWLTFADHYEPLWNGADEATGAERIARWAREWPLIASKFHDATGRSACYTFFYPQEEYRPRLMDPLASLAQDRIADVEVHLHHDGEGQQNFIDRMTTFIETLQHRHGLLRRLNGKPAFGFIHGNWALDNSRPDGRMCGLNNEIGLLRDLGCYADFTMPSAPSPTQSRLINTFYWAVDDPDKPKSYDHGIPVTPGSTAAGDLLMIPGPLGVRWTERLLPRLENGELACYDPPTPYRVRRWIDLAPRIGADSFVKLHSHGLQERHSAFLLQGGLELALNLMTEECRRAGCELRFASAWEMRQAVEAAREARDAANPVAVPVSARA